MNLYSDRIWAVEEDQRTPYQRDRDRILYSRAFRRLAGVTQVVSPSEGHVFHNRLTHSLEVAQIARRLAETLCENFPDESQALGEIDADVTEAAALAHDLGHPPFGHIAEHELDQLARQQGNLNDGFEGNAQSFREVTKLSLRQSWWITSTREPVIKRRPGEYGLNLTRATLNGILKYPRTWGPDGERSKKWGVYDSEALEFAWVRKVPPTGDSQCVEAAIMDWADDIAYSIHDTEDFYCAGLIPLDRLVLYEDERQAFLESYFARQNESRTPVESDEQRRLTNALDEFCELPNPITDRYSGKPVQQLHLKSFVAWKIGEFVRATQLQNNPHQPLRIPQNILDQVKIVKQLVWHYVILNPALATQHHGKQAAIRYLFETFMDASNRKSTEWQILPPRFQQVLKDTEDENGGLSKSCIVRNTVDAISSFTDAEALAAFHRLSGISPGSVMDRQPS